MRTPCQEDLKKQAFPNKFLWFTLGWKDLGKVNGTYSGNCMTDIKAHDLCLTALHVGKENGRLFLFCPRCLVKCESK